MRIEADQVTMMMNERTIMENESVVCSPGALTALVGPSGAERAKQRFSMCLACFCGRQADGY